MSSLANLYPGHLVVELLVIVVAAVTILSALAWMVSLFLARYPAIRHWVLLSALVALLASPLMAAAFVATGTSLVGIPAIAAVESPNPAPRLPQTTPDIVVPESAPVARDASSTGNLDVAPVTPTPLEMSARPSNPFRPTIVAILLLWLCGTAVSIMGLTRSGLLLHRLRQSMQPVADAEIGTLLDDAQRLLGARTSPAVMVSSLARSPLATGLFRPVIVLPIGLTRAISREQLRDVLLHELAHIERFDNLVVLLQAVAKTAFWPIVFVHLLNRQLARAREDICDNHVLACRDAVHYGETLLRLAQLACGMQVPVGAVGILHWRGKLEERICGLIHQGRSKMTRTPPLIAISVLSLFLAASAFLSGTTLIAARGGDQQAAPAKPSVPPDASAEAPGVLSGQVVQAEGGMPVGGANLLLRDLGNGSLRRATTDEMGRFQFKDTPQGQYHIWAFKESLVSPRELVIGQTKDAEAKPHFSTLRLPMSPGKQIKVNVTAASGEPMEGAKVSLGYPDRQSSVTAKDGTALLQALLPERYSLTIQAAGHAQVLRELDLKGADRVTLQSVSLAPGGTINGMVRDENQEPLVKAFIVFRTLDLPIGSYGESPYADQKGKFRHSHLPLNTPIRISTSMKGYLPQEQEVILTDRQSNLQLNFQLTRLPPGGSVHGVVTDANGKPIVEASVGNFGNSPEEERRMKTDESGRFAMDDVKKNHYGHEVVVRAPGYVAARQKFEPATKKDSPAISIKLEKGHSIRVRVQNTAGQPIPGAYVDVNDAGRAFSLGEFLKTDREGQFKSDTLPPNSTFLVYATGYSSSERKQLTLDGKETVVVTLEPTGLLRGKVVDAATGKAIKQFRVRIGFSTDARPGDVREGFAGDLNDPGLTFQSADGAFAISDLKSGMPFQVIVEAEGYERAIVPRIVAQPESTSAATSISLKKREPLKLATLTGKVISHKGNPVHGVQMRLVVSAEPPKDNDDNRFNWALIDSGQLAKQDYVEQYLSTVTDEEGKFEFKELLPGMFLQLAYWGKNAPKGRTAALAKTEPSGSHAFTLQLSEPAAIRGSFDAKAFADVSRMSLALQGQSFHHYQQTIATGKSDFAFEDLPSGQYFLEITGQPERVDGSSGAFTHRRLAVRLLTVKAGEELKVQFTKEDRGENGK